MDEYSYFRAEGRSRDAVEEVVDSKAKIEKITRNLARSYGAYNFSLWPGRNGEKDRASFCYLGNQKVSERLVVDEVDKDPDGTVHAVFASPKPGTVDEFNVVNMTGKIKSARERSRLETVFGCGKMPEKKFPAGKYSMAFVRAKTVIGKWESGGYSYEPRDAKNEGNIRDTVTGCGGSNSAMRGTDDLDSMKLDGDWYIRVPNDKTGKPLFTPPDAVPMKFSHMLKLDEQEWAIRRGYKPPPLKKPWNKKPSGP